MSTDPKSAVPAGATHQCRKCRAFYRLYRTKNKNTFDYLSERHCEPACSMSDLEPIAEAGPAPTTAAPADPGDDLLGNHLTAEAEREQASTPAEQLSGKVETTFAWLAEHRPPGATREPCYGGEDANGVAFHTADHNAAKRFPTKAAAEAWITERIPREGFKAVEHGWFGSPAEQPGKAADPRPAQPQAPAEQWRSPECQYELPRLLEIASRHVPQEAEAFVRDLRAAAEHFREHPPAAPSEAPLAEEPRCQAVTRNGHRCGKEPHEEGDDEHEADNAAEGGSTLVWTEHYPHAEVPLDALREALKHAQEELRDGFIVCSSCGHEEPTGDLDVLTVYIDPALSAPPPPSREPASAPPRKAPQEGPDDARAEEFRLGWNAGWLAGREAAAQEAGVRFGTAAEDALFALAAPSSPEEQLPEGATTKKKLGAAPARVFIDAIRQRLPGLGLALEGNDRALAIARDCEALIDQLDADTLDPAPAQPEARDAEIARLREAVEAENLGAKAEQGRLAAENARLTNELEEARAQSRMDEKLATDALAGHVAGKLRADAAEAETKALREALGRLEWQHREMDQAGDPPSCPVCGGSKPHHLAGCWLRAILVPPEPKAETPAETAGQKEGL